MWREAVASSIDARVAQKRLGRRVPHPAVRHRAGWAGTGTPQPRTFSPGRAARAQAVERDLRPDAANPELRSLVRSCIATGGRLTAEQLDVLSHQRMSAETEEVRWPITLVVSASVVDISSAGWLSMGVGQLERAVGLVLPVAEFDEQRAGGGQHVGRRRDVTEHRVGAAQLEPRPWVQRRSRWPSTISRARVSSATPSPARSA